MAKPEEQVETQVITKENADNLVFEFSHEWDYSTSFNMEARKAKESREVKMSVSLKGVTLGDILDSVSRDLSVKANTRIKGEAAASGVSTSEEYLSFLEKKKGKFSFTWDELTERKSPRKLSHMEKATRSTAKLSAEELQDLRAQIEAQLAEAGA